MKNNKRKTISVLPGEATMAAILKYCEAATAALQAELPGAKYNPTVFVMGCIAERMSSLKANKMHGVEWPETPWD